MKADGVITTEVDGEAMSEPVIIEPPESLIVPGLPTTSIGVSTQYSYPFGNGKVSVLINLSCAQTTEHIERAVGVAFTMGRTLALDKMDVLAEDIKRGVGQL